MTNEPLAGTDQAGPSQGGQSATIDDPWTIEKHIGNSVFRLIKEDVTDIEIEAFVFYARRDLTLGAGYGGAISQRGGLAIQKELEEFGTVEMTKAVVSSAGEMKADHIIHAVGPKFREENEEGKLEETMRNSLALADEQKFTRVAFPLMGTGFYCVPLDLCSRVMVQEIARYLEGETGLQEVIVAALDSREFKPFAQELNKLS